VVQCTSEVVATTYRGGWSGFRTYPTGLCNVSVGVIQRIGGGSERIRWGCITYLGWLHNVSDGVRNRVRGVRNRVDASLDVSVGVVQRIRGGSGRIRRGCTTYPLGLCNVSGVVRNRVGGVLRWSVGVRNRVDASLDVFWVFYWL